jgi:hypothetical protein
LPQALRVGAVFLRHKGIPGVLQYCSEVYNCGCRSVSFSLRCEI